MNTEEILEDLYYMRWWDEDGANIRLHELVRAIGDPTEVETILKKWKKGGLYYDSNNKYENNNNTKEGGQVKTGFAAQKYWESYWE